MASSIKKSIDATLESLLEKVKPKARYTSQLHVEQYNDSIYKEIINGDIDIPKERQTVDKKDGREKEGFDDMLRRRFLSQVQKEKEGLEHKLGYISNSINSLKKYEELRAAVRSPQSSRVQYSMVLGRGLNQEWREEIKKRQRELSEKKKKAQQQRRKKDQQMKQYQARLKQQQNQKKKKQIMQKMKAIQQRMKNRDEQIRIGNQKIIKMKRQKLLHQKINQSYQQKQTSFLQQQKKKLAQIRSLKKPIDQNQLKQHQQKFLQLKKQKQQLRQRQRKMNQSRSKTYKPMYQSMFYKKIVQGEKNEEQNPITIKTEKMRQFAQHVKEHFMPEVSEKKRGEIEEVLEREKRKEQERLEKERQLLQKSKVKGMQYLQQIRQLPKKKPSNPSPLPPQSDRIKYTNYLTHHSQNTAVKQPWTKILNSSNSKETKALQIQYQSQKMEEGLKRREQQARLLKQGNSNEIDQEYFKMIKAKLDLLGDG